MAAVGENFNSRPDTKIPEGKYYASTGVYQNLEAVEEQLKALIHNPDLKGADADLVRGVANLVGDWDARNKAGIGPLMPFITEVLNLRTIEDVNTFLQDTERSSFELDLPSISVVRAPDYPEYQTLRVDRLPSLVNYGDDYEADAEVGQSTIAVKKAVVIYLLQRIGFSEEEAEAVFTQDLTFERMLAPYMYTRKDAVQADYDSRCNNSYTGDQLRELAGNYPIMDILSAWGLGDSAAYLVKNPVYMQALSDVWIDQNSDLIKSYLLVQYLWRNCKNIDRETYDYEVEQENIIFGTEGTKSDEEMLLKDVQRFAKRPLDSLYVKVHCSEETKEEIQQICLDSIAYYRTMLEDVSWLSDETRAAAIDKLDHMNVFSCYPDEPEDFSGYDITDCKDIIALKKVLAAGEIRDMQQELVQKFDRNKWDYEVLASSANAFHTLNANCVYICNSILGGDIYQKDWAYEQKLAGIGVIIGHEISHAFDSRGSQYGATGGLLDWWALEDAAKYDKRIQKLVDYYDHMTPDVYDKPYNGRLVNGEALADMMGMKAMLGIAATKENFDYDLFFQQYARAWNFVETKEAMRLHSVDDPHPLSYLRINATVQQFDEFMKTYDIKPGDGMYLAPEDRVLVW